MADQQIDSNSNIIASKVVSWAGPSEMEKQNNEPLEEWSQTQIEPKEESDRRLRVLRRLNTMMNLWIRHVMINVHHMSEKDAARYEGRIFTTGSYRYNVHTSGSDIDAVLIAPNLVTREHFFKSFVERLSAEPLITEMTPVYTAKVPIIAMKFDGIDMDLSFGSIQQEKVPVMITDDLLRGLDAQSVRSANAVRVAHQLLEHAPEKYQFRVSLRFIKQWAKVRGIHGSQYGFPTGIGWALLVCNACQCYPKKNAAGILAAFFRMYKTWFQPNKTNTAIFLSEKRITSNEFGQSWDPERNKWDAYAMFPVLTPVAPSTNACDMVKEHTLRILCKEFARGHELLSNAMSVGSSSSRGVAAAASASASPSTTTPSFGVWSSILDPLPFFEDHKLFCHIQVSCLSSAVDRYKPFFDCVESRLNRLISSGKGLDRFPQLIIRPWPKRFEEPQQTAYVEEALRRQRSMTVNTLAAGGGDASPNNSNVNANNSATTATLAPLVPPSKLLTGHIYIGLEVDQTKKNPPPFDLAEAVRHFIENIVTDPSNFHQGITMTPSVAIEDVSKIPTWIYDPSKSKVLKQRAEEAAAAKKREEEEEARRQQLAEAGGEDGADSSSAALDIGDSGAVVGQKRPREADANKDASRKEFESSGSSLPSGPALRPQGFAGIASITSTMANVAQPSAANNQSAAVSSQAQPLPPIISIVHRQSLVNLAPSVVIQPPSLINTDINVDDELGMDF